jgi:outer membrane lipoprotein SlyB
MRKTGNDHATDPVRIGVFADMSAADAAVARLHAAGFEKERITVVCSPSCPHVEFGDHQDKPPAGTSTPKAAASGGAIGALLGGFTSVAGAMIGGGTGLLVAGPLVLGVGGGALAGAFIGAMLSRGVETEATDFYDQAVQEGKVLVSVETIEENREQRLSDAERILREAGAEPHPLNKQ